MFRYLQRVIQTIPVIIISAIVLWSYYAFVISLCHVLPEPGLKVFYLVVYHVAFIAFFASYLRAIFSDPGSVPHQFYLTALERETFDRASDPREFLEEVALRLPVHECTLSNGVRYCEVCMCVKPDRSHHCSLCRRCVLKMDHHCPWINNCVGYNNYKFFVVFLFYSSVYTITVALFTAPWAVYIWNRVPELRTTPELDRFNIMVVFFVATMFFIAVSGLWVFHAFLTASNKSTLEMGRLPRFRNEPIPPNNAYDIGCLGNCREVYGSGPLVLCPIHTSRGTGWMFPRDRAERTDMRRLLEIAQSDEDEDNVGSGIVIRA